MNNTVMCIVRTQSHAESIVSELQRSGFASGNISVLFPSKSVTENFAQENQTKAPEAALVGAGAGGMVGGAIGLLAGLGALAIPGIGPFLAAGPILGALSGLATGAAMGGVAGGLVGMGIPEKEATTYEARLRGGHLLISVHADNTADFLRAEGILRRSRAEDIYSMSNEPPPATREVSAIY